MRDVVINISWLADRFEPALGDGSRWGLRLHYSYEGAEPLETGGGMLQGAAPARRRALHRRQRRHLDRLRLRHACRREPARLAHLVMVDNPAQHPRGDFRLERRSARCTATASRTRTYSGIGVYRPAHPHRLARGDRRCAGHGTLAATLQAGAACCSTAMQRRRDPRRVAPRPLDRRRHAGTSRPTGR